MSLSQTVITQQMVIAELIKAGINREIATDLSYRYYKNELTYKDLEYLESNFNFRFDKLEDRINGIDSNLNLKLEMTERSLKTDIVSVKNELDNKIDIRFNELDNKIDIVENNLNVKIDAVRGELKSDIKDLDSKIDSVSNEILLLRKDIEINRMEFDSKFNKSLSEFKSISRVHNWMFGTVITISIGIFLALMSLLVK